VCSAGFAGDKSPTELSFRTMGFDLDFFCDYLLKKGLGSVFCTMPD
jgi:hypothetical protein